MTASLRSSRASPPTYRWVPPLCCPTQFLSLTNFSDNHRFRIRAQRFLLTYSQIPDGFDRDGLAPFLKSVLIDVDCLVVTVEEHPNAGGYHIHVYVDHGSIFVINAPDMLDYCDVHPNIKPIRTTPIKAYDYVMKDGYILYEEGDAPELTKKQSGDEKWSAIMTATTKDSFLQQACDLAPRDTVLHFNSLQTFANWRYRDDHSEYKPPDYSCHCDEYPVLTDWVKSSLLSSRNGRRPSLVIWGPSLTGKTTWARSQGPHAYFGGLFMLEGFTADNVEYAIFDDLISGMYTVPQWKFWMGAQAENNVTDKYMHKQKVFWGKPCIYIANEDPRKKMANDDVAWLDKNCIFCEITSDLVTFSE